MPKDELAELGRKGRDHVLKNYNFEDYKKTWVNLLEEVHEKYGSWEERKGYKAWRMVEL